MKKRYAIMLAVLLALTAGIALAQIGRAHV